MPHTSVANSEQAAQQSIALLNRFIEERGLRRTREREIVLEAVASFNGARFTINQLETLVNASKPVLSRGTIVNSMRLLEQAALILKVGVHHRNALYQAAPQAGKRSKAARMPFVISLYCTNCGEVKNVRDRAATAPLASRRYGAFRPVSGVVTIHGLCANCKNQEPDTKQNKTKQ